MGGKESYWMVIKLTAEEIKQEYTMMDILEKYHYSKPNKRGFIHCPFHKEKTASMKIYKDGYYCFGCGEGGDIFNFVQKIYNYSFKEAFRELGGTYDNDRSFSTQLKKYHFQKRQEMRKKQEIKLKKERDLNNMLINIYRKDLSRFTPLTDDWGYTYNALQYQLYLHEELND